MNMKKALSPRALEARRKYHKTWRDRNKDKIREYARRHWERKAAQAA